MKSYEIISHLQTLGVWEETKCLAARLSTLDRYHQIYLFILEHEPQRQYGYIPRILKNSVFIQRFGNQYDETSISKIVHVMEQSFPK